MDCVCFVHRYIVNMTWDSHETLSGHLAGAGKTSWMYKRFYLMLPLGYKIVTFTKRAQPGAPWQPRWVGWSGQQEGGSRGWGHICTYGWFMLMYGRNQYNLVKQLSFNFRNKKRNSYFYTWIAMDSTFKTNQMLMLSRNGWEKVEGSPQCV